MANDQLEALLSGLDDVVFVMEFPSLKYQYISPSIEKLRGYTQEEVYATPGVLYQHMPHITHEIIVNYLTQFIGKGPSYIEYPMGSKSGQVKWYSSSFHFKEMEEGRYMIAGIMRDVTQKRTTALELEKLKTEYEDLYQNAPFGYHSLDTNGNIVRINDTELKWLGYERDELLGKSLAVTVFSDESKKAFAAQFSALKKQGWAKDLRLELVRKDGSIINLLLNATSVLDDNGEFLYSRSVLTDITELTEAEQKLKHSQIALEAINEELKLANQKLERLNFTKDVLLKIISHDLRNPLETIKLISSLLHDKYHELDAETVLRYVYYISQSGSHATHILDDMTGLIKLGSGVELEPKPTRLSEIVQEVLEFSKNQAGEKGISLAYEPSGMEGENVMVLADKKWLVRAIENLVTNAIKFSNSGTAVKVGCRTEGCYVVVTIADEGIGIPEAIKQTLLTELPTGSRTGTAGEVGSGLGLSIVKQIVELQGGEVKVDSEEGVGSVFHIKLLAAT